MLKDFKIKNYETTPEFNGVPYNFNLIKKNKNEIILAGAYLNICIFQVALTYYNYSKTNLPLSIVRDCVLCSDIILQKSFFPTNDNEIRKFFNLPIKIVSLDSIIK